MKQETLEEVANEYSKKKYSIDYGYCEEDYYISFLSFIEGAKWQQGISYAEFNIISVKVEGINITELLSDEVYEEIITKVIEQQS